MERRLKRSPRSHIVISMVCMMEGFKGADGTLEQGIKQFYSMSLTKGEVMDPTRNGTVTQTCLDGVRSPIENCKECPA
jgi:hypothetical protein